MNIFLPGFNAELSSVKWQLDLHRAGGSRKDVSLWGGDQFEEIQGLNSEIEDVLADSSPQLKFTIQDQGFRMQGGLALEENHGVTAVQLKVEYWPDKNDDTGLAIATVREDKLATKLGIM
ncbi:hypothetical protein [Pseudomonas sp. S31]|uniref:hypothetical protein n=1 Tax=Pseudomonas sp. S31 TaxID=1564473 RepID=UPI001911C1E4|nr:hypothetical protein [Pseudomonas sp. S31]